MSFKLLDVCRATPVRARGSRNYFSDRLWSNTRNASSWPRQ